MTEKEAMIGTVVKSNRDFEGVPKGTEGLIDERYEGGVMVAWDLPHRRIPKGWKYTGQWAVEQGVPLRDGFGVDELRFLDLVL